MQQVSKSRARLSPSLLCIIPLLLHVSTPVAVSPQPLCSPLCAQRRVMRAVAAWFPSPLSSACTGHRAS